VFGVELGKTVPGRCDPTITELKAVQPICRAWTTLGHGPEDEILAGLYPPGGLANGKRRILAQIAEQSNQVTADCLRRRPLRPAASAVPAVPAGRAAGCSTGGGPNGRWPRVRCCRD
jgi:hypothetical protein